jgi:iron complex outermembrane receptor protein
LVGDHTLAEGTVRAAFTFADTRHIETLDRGEASRFRQQLWSLAAEAEQPLGRKTDDTGPLSDLTLTGGLSLDRASTPETGGREARIALVDWGTRVGVSALIAGGSTRLHGGVSRRVRFPSLRELYSGGLGRFIPNPDLEPEVLVVGELGATAELGGLEGQVVLFHQRWSDAIVRSSVGDGTFRRENRNRVTATGIELLASLRLGPALLGGDLTLQGVALRDELAPQTEREPEYQPEVFGDLEFSGPLALGVWGTAAVGYVGPQYCVNPELEADQRLSASGRLDLLLGREWRLGGPLSILETSLALDNATDATVFDQCGLPQPGRTLRLQVRVR